MKPYFLFIFTILISIPLSAQGAGNSNTIDRNDVRSELSRLDRELALRDRYLISREHETDSLMAVAADTTLSAEARLNNILMLGDKFSSFETASALNTYLKGYKEALAARNDTMAVKFLLRRATYLPLNGYSENAIAAFNSVDTTAMSRSMLEFYFDSGRQMFNYIALFHQSDDDDYEKYMSLSHKYQEKLIPVLDHNSVKYKLNLGEYYYAGGEYAKADAVLRHLLESIDEQNNIYARACHILSDVAEARHQEGNRILFLTRSAIADIKSATREVASLQELGGILSDYDEIERAHNYLAVALSNAVECHAPLRMIQSAKVIPLIEKAHRKQLANSRIITYGVIVLLGVLLLLLAFTMRQLYSKIRIMNSLTEKLEDANRVKDVYISEFLNLCSVYIDKLNQFSKIVNRKLAAGKADDLFKLTKSGKFIEEQSGEFYKVFDDAFLHIYPGFVEGVNALLLPSEQIVLKDGERLNTDLRILAFMRLGIHESNRIAQLLNYSIHTIYAYRNKLRNRAVDRDRFETEIMSIPSISETAERSE